MERKECIECSKSDSKYKCPTCKRLYCSAICYKQHKGKCIIVIEEGNENKPIEQVPLKLNEYDDVILSSDQLSKLKDNQKIMMMLRNKKLKRIIKTIDQAKYKKNTLEQMQLDEDFKDFCGEILNTLGFVKNHCFTIQPQ